MVLKVNYENLASQDGVFLVNNPQTLYWIDSSAYIPLRKMREDLKLRSTKFTVTHQDDQVILRGRGFGHGVGLCQEGAIRMAQLGFNYTDIITFDLSPSGKDPLEAELYISVERVKDNAALLGQPFYRELHRVIFHGLLHLLGYKDKQKKDQALMRALEDRLLAEYFL